MIIPRILHQTWKSEELPPTFKKWVSTWKERHPSWQHILWTDEMNRKFIATDFPWFLETYDAYETNIQRVDAARYFILYHYGGVYVDMDFACLRNIEPLLEGETCVLGREHDEHCKTHKKSLIISNAFIACAPKHPFISMLCNEAGTALPKTYSSNTRVLESTGPFMLTRVFEQFPEKKSLKVLHYSAMYPLTKSEAKKALPVEEAPAEIKEKLKNAFAIHYYYGTWWRFRKKKVLSVFGIKFKNKK